MPPASSGRLNAFNAHGNIGDYSYYATYMAFGEDIALDDSISMQIFNKFSLKPSPRK